MNKSFGNSLIVKRFDRQDDGARIHMEDFAQVFGLYPGKKYESASFDRIAYVILSEAGEADFLEFIRRLVFTVAIGNGDMHLKNWSLVYADARSPRLSPAYDFVPTILYLPDDDLALRLGGERSFRQIGERHFSTLASRAAASERLVLSVVRETAERIREAWTEMRADLPLPGDMKEKLDAHINNVKLLAASRQ